LALLRRHDRHARVTALTRFVSPLETCTPAAEAPDRAPLVGAGWMGRNDGGLMVESGGFEVMETVRDNMLARLNPFPADPDRGWCSGDEAALGVQQGAQVEIRTSMRATAALIRIFIGGNAAGYSWLMGQEGGCAGGRSRRDAREKQRHEEREPCCRFSLSSHTQHTAPLHGGRGKDVSLPGCREGQKRDTPRSRRPGGALLLSRPSSNQPTRTPSMPRRIELAPATTPRQLVWACSVRCTRSSEEFP
jgi:hypothetical protein